MSNIGKEMTFWSLINEFSICIPIIQRDYIQGRNKDQVIDARRNLLREMRVAIITDGRIDLNFVYGKVHDRDGNKVFFPLDGQQRLTTLFLLHWFAFAKSHNFSKLEILQRFSYETRTSSRKFIKQLVRNTGSLADAVIDRSKKISEQIQNEAWFWVDWSYDPTIDSMLLMLDEIKERFIDVDDLASRLTTRSSISFRFLDMFDLGMEDSLYIKLNARGKPLTDFENFKAELVKYVKQSSTDGTLSKMIADNFATELDGKWTDLFWHWTSGDRDKFDKIYMNCFHWMLWNRWAETQTLIWKSNYIITSAMNRTAYYRLNSYMDYGAVDGKVLEDIYHSLEYFSTLPANSGDVASDCIKYFEKCVLGSGTALTYEDRVMLAAITSFISHNKGTVDLKVFGNWIRVLGNLAKNSRLDGLDDFVRAVQSIAGLTNHSSDLLAYLATSDCTISGFLSEQIEEERLKAKLIIRDDGWTNAIYEAEKHPYFAGQIASLLSFTKLDIQTVDDLNDAEIREHLKSFISYKKKMTAIFNAKGLAVNADLFSRAILSKGDYMLSFRRCKSFLIDNHRDISWKTLLRNSNADKRAFLKTVLDELDVNDLSMNNIEKQLWEIVDKAIIDDWRYYLIKTDKLLDNCGYNRLIYVSPDGRMLLVSSQSTSGYNKEYYTYVLYLKLLAKGEKPHYSPDRGQYGKMFIDKIGDKDVTIKSTQNNSSVGDTTLWEFQIDYEGNTHREKTVEDAINYISTLS